MKRILLLMILALMTVSIWAERVQIGGIYYNLTDGSTRTAEVTYSTSSYTGYKTIPSTVRYNNNTYSVTSIGSSAFSGCSSLTSVSIPNSVTSIGSSAFRGCSGLTSLTIPTSVRSIGSSAFESCSGFTSFTIPSSVTSIGSTAFQNCSKLQSINIPNSVTSIGISAFRGCTSLTSVTIPSSVTSIVDNMFRDCTGLISFTIPNFITSIGDGAFYGCSGITNIEIPSSVTSIGGSAFYGCSKLASITIPSSVTSIGFMAFSSCIRLSTVNVTDLTAWCNIKFDREGSHPFNYSNITHYLYLNGESVQDLVIPNSTTKIGEYTFYNCRLNSVTIPNSVTSIGKSAFDGCGLTTVNISDLSAWTNIIFESGLPTHKLCLNDEEIEDLIIPNSVTSIGKYAFSGCPGLTSVTIPNSVTSIGEFAFYNCSGITSVEIPNSVAIIEQSTFNGCNKLNSITIPTSVESIKYRAFYGCESLTSVTLPNSLMSIGDMAFANCPKLTSVIIPNSVTSIGEQAYFTTSSKGESEIKSVIIGSSVTRIGTQAFYGRNLKDVTCLAIVPPITSTWNFGYEGSGASFVYDNTTIHVLPGCKAAYEAANYWKNFTIVEDAFDPSTRRTITFGASDYATYCSDANLDFSEVEGIKAYIASSYNPGSGSLTITRVDNVPAGEGMLLKGTAGESYDVPTTDNASVVANLLKGNTTATTLYPTDGDYTNYVLSKNNEDVMGFYRFTGSVAMPANKAWLQIPTSALGGGGAQANVRGFRLVEEGEEMTAISEVKSESEENNIIYDLQGRRVNSVPSRGVYIKNGKKIIMK